MALTPDEKLAKAIVEASHNRIINPYHIADLIKIEGGYPAVFLNRLAIGWFVMNEIDYKYGVGDPYIGEIASRIIHEVLDDYEDIPDYNPNQ